MAVCIQLLLLVDSQYYYFFFSGRRAFSVAGPMAWNVLPDDLRDPSLSADNFRKKNAPYLFYGKLHIG